MNRAVEKFGEMPDGADVHRVRLSNGSLRANFITYGAILQDLRLAGHDPALVLGFEEFAPYLKDSPYFGATAGRVANRIRDGHLQLDGRTHQLDTNFLGKHHLHGGAAGIGKRLWSLGDVTRNSVTMTIDLRDGEMGYPGNMRITATFKLLDVGALDIRYSAQTDAPTICNLAHHSYFNLDGGADILDHELLIMADRYLPVDEELIPTGASPELAGHPFDFRTAKPIRIASDTGLLDHNFCVGQDRGNLRPIARLASPRSGVAMTIKSTEPGLQLYDGRRVDVGPLGLDGAKMSAHAGVALEPQLWPDALHHDGFASTILRPHERYEQHSQFVFSQGN